jgi:dTDP-4-dehydrorhamnose 3,5-epimerase
MKIEKAPMAGLWSVEIEPRWDERGSFGEALNTAVLRDHGIAFAPVQANLSMSARQGQVRGMHYQAAPHGQAKLVLALGGRIYDAVVDVRRGSPSFGQWYGVSLSSGHGLFIPGGFAHGWQAIEAGAEILYFVDGPWSPSAERGLSPLDPEIGIRWIDAVLCSPRDLGWPSMASLKASGYSGEAP